MRSDGILPRVRPPVRPTTSLVPLALVLGGLALATPARATDTWTTPFDGVKRLQRVTANPNLVTHAVVVDLSTPGVHLQATATDQRKRTTSSYAKLVGAQIAVNADFFSYTNYATTGLAAGKGSAWPDTKDSTSSGTLAFDAATRVELKPLATVVAFDPSWMEGVVSGKPWVLAGGVVKQFEASYQFCTARHPRTVVGLSKDGKQLVVAVVDGRTTASVGMTCSELGTLMKGLGAHDAMNLDGGGSSTMVLQGAGVVNKPSDGSERVVANHLAIFAPKSGSVGSFHGVVVDAKPPGKPLAGASVSIADVASVTTEADGAYELAALPGTYTLTVKAPGYQTTTSKQTLAAGQDLALDFALEPDAAADFDGDGAPDDADVCPEVADPEQRDLDADGLGDACDGDDDGDGVMDEDDECPLEPGEGEECPSGASTTGGGASPVVGIRDTNSEASCAVHAARGGPGTAAWFAVLALARLRRKAHASAARGRHSHVR